MIPAVDQGWTLSPFAFVTFEGEIVLEQETLDLLKTDLDAVATALEENLKLAERRQI